MNPPGLVSREVLGPDKQQPEHFIVYEVWDVRVPGCPLIPLKHFPTRRDEDVAFIQRMISVHADIIRDEAHANAGPQN